MRPQPGLVARLSITVRVLSRYTKFGISVAYEFTRHGSCRMDGVAMDIFDHRQADLCDYSASPFGKEETKGPIVTVAECFPNWSVIPFLIILLSMAVLPLVIPAWWESNRNKLAVSVVVSIPVLILVLNCRPYLLKHSMQDYTSFIILLGSLYVISGGIHIRGAFAGTPLVNTTYLAIGAVLANFIGTTGASMLLIRPYMRANARRQRRAHLVIFFIFLVSNIAGLLTPLGDPPLFLGFLRGVPFFWTLKLFPQWALAVGILLVIFNLVDQYIFNKEDVETPGSLVEEVHVHRRLHIEGSRNLLYLLGVMMAASLSGYLRWPRGIQELIMIAMAVFCWIGTSRSVRAANHFHFSPILEVAVLFLGIFITMIPALEILSYRAAAWDLKHPWQFFWLSGTLSSFLDNAPTYLTFAAMASGIFGGNIDNLATLLGSRPGADLLAAVSCGAVFMGANTYIGNGPNLMVRSIAEHAGIKMPSFGGYMLYSGTILIPLFLVISLVFF
jgi:Na+/H+ antiporter NhaD/arsenite permease-like protein